jgi:FlaA1/EpsC-like NDP-sugar epimerase
MERFFMTIPEASRLVLEAAGVCEGGEVMVLDMGEPIRIVTLAEQMIRLSGFEPGVDIEIVYTGIRPGEKLHEELTHPDETLEPTRVDKIFTWRRRASPVPMTRIIEVLAPPCADPDEVRARIAAVLPEYRWADPRRAAGLAVETVPAPAAAANRAHPPGAPPAEAFAARRYPPPDRGDEAREGLA